MGPPKRRALTALLISLAALLSLSPAHVQSQVEQPSLRAFPGSLIMISLSKPARSAETDIPGARIEITEMLRIELAERAELSETWRPAEISEGLWAVLVDLEPPKVMYGERYDLQGSLRLGDLLVVPPGMLTADAVVAKFSSRVKDFTFTESNRTLVLTLEGEERTLTGVADNSTGSWLFLDEHGGDLYRLRGDVLGRYTVLPTSRVGEAWYASVGGSYALVSADASGAFSAYLLDRALPVTGEIPLSPAFDFFAVKLPSEEVIRVLSSELRRGWAALISIPPNASVKTYTVAIDGKEAYRVRLILPGGEAAILKLPESPAVAGSEIKATLRLSGRGTLNAAVYLTDPPLSASLTLPRAGPGELPVAMALPHLASGTLGSLGAYVTLNDTLILSTEKKIGILPSVQLICLNGSNVYARAGGRVRLAPELLNRGARNVTMESLLLRVDGGNLTFPASTELRPGSVEAKPVELNLSPGSYRVMLTSEVRDEAFDLNLQPTVGPITIHVVESPLSLRVDLPEETLPLVPFNVTLAAIFNAPAQGVDLNVTVPEDVSILGRTSYHVEQASPNETLKISLQMKADRPGRFPLHIVVEGKFPWGPVREARTVNVTVGAALHSYTASGPSRIPLGEVANISLRVSGPAGVASARFPAGFEIIASNGTTLDNLTLEFPVPGTVWVELRADVEPGSYLLPAVLTVNNTVAAGDPLRVSVVERTGVTREGLVGRLTELRRRVKTLRERSLLPWATSPAGLDELEEALDRAERQIAMGDYQSAARTLSEVEDELSRLEAAPRRELDPIVPLTITLLVSSALMLWAAARWERVGG